MTRIKARVFQMRVDDEFLTAIDEWRRKQPDLPPRAAAIRALVARALGKQQSKATKTARRMKNRSERTIQS